MTDKEFSGTRDYAANARAICKEALLEIGEIADEESIPSNLMKLAQRRFNYMLKTLSGPENSFIKGMKVWQRTRFVLNLGETSSYVIKNGSTTLGDATSEYDITNPSGSTFRYTYTGNGTDPAISGAYITGDTISITSAAMDSGNVVTDAVITGAGEDYIEISNSSGVAESAKVGKIVLDSAIDTPIDLLSVIRRDEYSNDTPVLPMLFSQYEAIPNKTDEGTPEYYYYERNQVNEYGTMYLNYVPADTDETLHIVSRGALQDISHVTEDIDFPQEMYTPLYLILATLLADPLGREVTTNLRNNADRWLGIADTFEPQQTDMFFQPDLD